MHRKGYKKRWVGHRGQEISNNALKDCEKFLYDIIKLRKQYKFNIKDIKVSLLSYMYKSNKLWWDSCLFK